uniref:KH_dom_type_1 domain-containing protein n=1 Tax=Parastrongyloides trichosuri TaxID=131310 RepID=A0A0N4ZH35_PARTI
MLSIGDYAKTNIREGIRQRSDDLIVVIPGQKLNLEPDDIRGSGIIDIDGTPVSTVCGILNKVNKLVKVNPYGGVYNGEVGDVVVGRVVEVQQKRWKLDISSRQEALLNFTNFQLPGVKNQRRNLNDEIALQSLLVRGDLISGEIHSIYQDGTILLQTRSSKYGKLGKGVLVKVPFYLVKRSKSHLFKHERGVSFVFGCNGSIWVYPSDPKNSDLAIGWSSDPHNDVPKELMLDTIRFANCVKILATYHLDINDWTVSKAFELSQYYDLKDISQPSITHDIAVKVLEEMKHNGMFNNK